MVWLPISLMQQGLTLNSAQSQVAITRRALRGLDGFDMTCNAIRRSTHNQAGRVLGEMPYGKPVSVVLVPVYASAIYLQPDPTSVDLDSASKNRELIDFAGVTAS